MTTQVIHVGRDGWPLRGEIIGHGELVVMLHGGGPDHHSMRPLAHRLAHRYRVALPDIRGYGASVCRDPALHRWAQYVDDTIATVEALGATSAHLVGAGLGGTIALRACLRNPAMVRSAVIISAEAIEDDDDKAADTQLMDDFADRTRSTGLQSGWDLFLPHLHPLIANLVREALPRSDAESAAAAAAIGHDRAFTTLDELALISTPTLVIAGDDARHPSDLAHALANTLPQGRLSEVAMSHHLRDAEQMAEAFAPAIAEFLRAAERTHNDHRAPQPGR
uniref:Alpha/beta hydrolase fold protein n=2 Tax=unclassified Mycobacterium TaxID=2642494 RepID=A0A5Q5BH75_MYCSS